MKQFISICFVLMCSVLCVQNILAGTIRDEILDKGHWGDDDMRSFVPAPPKAIQEEGKSISLNFATPISDLKVVITDNNGKTVYEEIISVSTPQSHIINLGNLTSGEYTLTVSNRYGNLFGLFVLE